MWSVGSKANRVAGGKIPIIQLRKLTMLVGCDRAIPNPNLLIKSFARKIKHLLKNIVVLYSPGSYANALDVGL